MELECVLPLKALLKDSAPVWTEPAITLLSELSSHPPNKVRVPTKQRPQNVDL